MAVSKGIIGASNIWLLDLSRDSTTRFTFGSSNDIDPVWSPDGSRIIFTEDNVLYQRPVSGVKDAEVLQKSSQLYKVPTSWKGPTSWSRDGRFLFYTALDPRTRDDIWVLPLEGGAKPVPFLVTKFDEHTARISPDGHWVSYVSDESGREEVYVRSFSMNSAGTAVEAGARWPISSEGGIDPRWRDDGRELYYRSLPDKRIKAVEIVSGPVFQAGRTRTLGFAVSPLEAVWDSSADGRKFLVTTPVSNKPEPYTVVLNWQAGLKR